MMIAEQHTASMLRWWNNVGVSRADLAIRRSCGAMVWHHDLSFDALPLGWAKAENVRQGDVYIRPARGYSWPLVFLDDLSAPIAIRVVHKYDVLVVETSKAGGCHLWLACTRTLDEEERYNSQKWLVSRIEADPGSISGEHLGRLAGFKNWKRGGTWVNVLDASLRGRRWCPILQMPVQHPDRDRPVASARDLIDSQTTGFDSSESGTEWGWVCGLLEAGFDENSVFEMLVDRAGPRRGKDVIRYARRTIREATKRTSGIGRRIEAC
jgi:hypothetical protein